MWSVRHGSGERRKREEARKDWAAVSKWAFIGKAQGANHHPDKQRRHQDMSREITAQQRWPRKAHAQGHRSAIIHIILPAVRGISTYWWSSPEFFNSAKTRKL